jgi:putative phage-type endonuclease
MEQGTPEWLAIRCGKVTASRMADLMAKTKSGPSASRANYMAELIVERLTGKPADMYINVAMQWGTEQEPHARLAYEAKLGVLVNQVAFVPHPKIELSGCSPDGLIDDDGMVEIKCPNTATHIETCITRTVPQKYQTQMQWQMACTGRKWVDFISYDPRLPDNIQLFIKRVERDDAAIANMEKEVIDFLKELDAKIVDLQEAFNKE